MAQHRVGRLVAVTTTANATIVVVRCPCLGEAFIAGRLVSLPMAAFHAVPVGDAREPPSSSATVVRWQD